MADKWSPAKLVDPTGLELLDTLSPDEFKKGAADLVLDVIGTQEALLGIVEDMQKVASQHEDAQRYLARYIEALAAVLSGTNRRFESNHVKKALNSLKIEPPPKYRIE